MGHARRLLRSARRGPSARAAGAPRRGRALEPRAARAAAGHGLARAPPRSTWRSGCSAAGLRGLAGRSLARARGASAGWAGRRRRACWPRWSWARAWPPRAAGRAPRFRTPAESARYLLPRYGARPVETFGLLALDVRHRLKREAVISVGCLTSSLVHPREVFQEAVVARAAALVLFHNHPSGDPGAFGRGPRAHAAPGVGGHADGHRGARPPRARAPAAS